MEEDKARYWKLFRVWIYGLLVSFPTSGLLSYLLRDRNPSWVIPVIVAILFSPLVLLGAYGIKYRVCMSGPYGYIHRGTPAVIGNLCFIALYVAILILISWAVRAGIIY